jgi:hypothetical protein
MDPLIKILVRREYEEEMQLGYLTIEEPLSICFYLPSKLKLALTFAVNSQNLGDFLVYLPREQVSFVNHGDEGTIIKKHFISVMPKDMDFEINRMETFYCSADEADRFIKIWEENDEPIRQKELDDEMKEDWKKQFFDSLYEECKSTGRVQLLPYINDHLFEIQRFLGEDVIVAESYLPDVFQYISKLISEDILPGLLDKNKIEYTDRQLITHEERIINVNVQMDFNSLINQLGNKGIMLTSFQCPQCGSPCTIPKTGSSFKCESCGDTIEVTDVFDKFKGILN